VARVSDRRLLAALLERIGVAPERAPGVFSVIDKVERQPRDVSTEKLATLGMTAAQVQELFALFDVRSPGELRERYGASAAISERLDDLERYFEYLGCLDVARWARLDLTVVRGLAYYTGIVFELFDAQGDFRAICGGGRYDDLLKSLGNADLPALGFGMGDVVLGELLRARGLRQAPTTQPDFWVASEREGALADVMGVATTLRRAGASVEYALRPQALGKQRKAAFSAGASYFLLLAPDFAATRRVELHPLAIGDGASEPALLSLVRDAGSTAESVADVVGRHRHVLRSFDPVHSTDG
jgi:histidyl-tRNA synthetase